MHILLWYFILGSILTKVSSSTWSSLSLRCLIARDSSDFQLKVIGDSISKMSVIPLNWRSNYDQGCKSETQTCTETSKPRVTEQRHPELHQHTGLHKHVACKLASVTALPELGQQEPSPDRVTINLQSKSLLCNSYSSSGIYYQWNIKAQSQDNAKDKAL